MTVATGVNFEELSRSTDEFNGAQLKAVSLVTWMPTPALAIDHDHMQLIHRRFAWKLA